MATLLGHGHDVLCAVYSPDGARISTGGRDAKLRVWDTSTFEEIVALGGHADYVFALAWSPNGERLISSSGDGTLRIWDTSPAARRLQARQAFDAHLARVEQVLDGLGPDLTPTATLEALSGHELSERERMIARQRPSL